MIKCAFPVMNDTFLLLFNRILNLNLYPSVWKDDILGPLHKSGCKDDPSNFRGISISSCLGKLFSSLLRNRLEAKCIKENLISSCQISGKKGARTSDHLLVFRHFLRHSWRISRPPPRPGPTAPAVLSLGFTVLYSIGPPPLSEGGWSLLGQPVTIFWQVSGKPTGAPARWPPPVPSPSLAWRRPPSLRL